MSDHLFGQKGATFIALASALAGSQQRSERQVNRSVATSNKFVDPAGCFE
jgi:hypothetical protein